MDGAEPGKPSSRRKRKVGDGQPPLYMQRREPVGVTGIAVHSADCDDGPVTTQEMTDWLSDRLDRDMARLLGTARDAADTPAGMVVTRLAMDQVSGIQSQRKIVEIAGKALAEDGDPRFGQILAWLAYARQTAPGYLETWAPDEIDLIAGLHDYNLDDESGR